MINWQKCVFTKVAINRKILAVWPNVFRVKVRMHNCILINCHKYPQQMGKAC